MLQRARWGLVASLIFVGANVTAACGGEEESDAKHSSGGSAGTGAVDAGTGGTGGGTGGTGGGSGGTGGTLECDTTACPAIGGIVTPCCKDDGTCGYDGSLLGLGCVNLSDLPEAGLPDAGSVDGGDPTCVDLNTGFITLPGCCAPTGECGWIIPVLGTCLDRSQVPPQVPLPDVGVPVPCGSGTGGTGGADGGGGTAGSAGSAGSAGGGAGGTAGSAGAGAAPSDGGAD